MLRVLMKSTRSEIKPLRRTGLEVRVSIRGKEVIENDARIGGEVALGTVLKSVHGLVLRAELRWSQGRLGFGVNECDEVRCGGDGGVSDRADAQRESGGCGSGP